MKIYLDNLVFSLQKIGGISVYWSSLLKRMNALKDEEITLINVKGKSKNLLGNKLTWSKVVKEDLNFSAKLIRLLPLLIKLPAKSLYHSSYLRISLQRDIVNIVTIHDLAAEEKMIKGIRKYLKLFLQSLAIRNADGIICVSNKTKEDLLRHYPSLHSKNVRTIYHGCSKSFYPIKLSEYDSRKNILFIGARNVYKNFLTCLKVMKALPEYNLVLVGGGNLTYKEKIEIESFLGSRYKYLGNLETDKLNLIYNSVHCLFYPTIYEGFGLPVLEAMKSGCPVVSSDIPAIREVACNSALLINPNANLEMYVDAIKSIEIKEIRQALTTKGFERAANFNLDNQFIETITFYYQIWNQRFL